MIVLPGVLSIALLVFLVWAQSASCVEITLGGDIILARSGALTVNDAGVFGSALPVLQRADLSAANLESPLAFDLSSQHGAVYNLCAPSTDAVSLASASFDLLSIANNHTYDCNSSGDLETLKWLNESGIRGVGGIEAARVVDVRGQKIAFLAYEDITKPVNVDKMLGDIASVRKTAAFVIMSLHWGMEYQAGPTARQRAIAQQLADAGVDVIWGHHPHVLQRIEWLADTESPHQTLVIYSLGNLYGDQFMLADTQRTALITLKLRYGKIVGIFIKPLVMDSASQQLVDAQKNDREWIFARLKWSSQIPNIVEIK